MAWGTASSVTTEQQLTHITLTGTIRVRESLWDLFCMDGGDTFEITIYYLLIQLGFFILFFVLQRQSYSPVIPLIEAASLTYFFAAP